jgi:serine/threonine protein kinase
MKVQKEKLENKKRNFLSNYEIEKSPVGSGAYGTVCKAFSKNTKKTVAIKTFHSNISRKGEGISQTIIREISVFLKKKIKKPKSSFEK